MPYRIYSVALCLALALVLVSVPALADQTCPGCKRTIADDYQFCPYDGTELEVPASCSACGRTLEAAWSYCPFDGTARGAAKPGGAGPSAGHGAGTVPAAPKPDDAVKAEPRADTPPTGPGLGRTPGANAIEGVERGGRDPLDTVDSLFAAIEGRNEADIKRLYRWSQFFAWTGERDALEEKVDGYVKRLLQTIPKTLPGRKRVPLGLKMQKDQAWMKVGLKDEGSRAMVQEYEFTLSNEGDGWRIIGIKP